MKIKNKKNANTAYKKKCLKSDPIKPLNNFSLFKEKSLEQKELKNIYQKRIQSYHYLKLRRYLVSIINMKLNVFIHWMSKMFINLKCLNEQACWHLWKIYIALFQYIKNFQFLYLTQNQSQRNINNLFAFCDVFLCF